MCTVYVIKLTTAYALKRHTWRTYEGHSINKLQNGIISLIFNIFFRNFLGLFAVEWVDVDESLSSHSCCWQTHFSFPRQRSCTGWKLAWNALSNAVVIVTCIWQPPVVSGLCYIWIRRVTDYLCGSFAVFTLTQVHCSASLYDVFSYAIGRQKALLKSLFWLCLWCRCEFETRKHCWWKTT